MVIFQCKPIAFAWEGWKDSTVPHQCVDVNILAYSAGAMNLMQDITILILPMPLIMRLNMNWRKKAGIVFMFSLGLFVIITSAIRLRFIVHFAKTTNPTWDYREAVIWTGLEVNVAIIVACLPAIRLWLVRVAPHAFTTTHQHSVYSNENSNRKKGQGMNKSESNIQARIKMGNDSGSEKSMKAMSPSILRNEISEGIVELELGDRKTGFTRTDCRINDETTFVQMSGEMSRHGSEDRLYSKL